MRSGDPHSGLGGDFRWDDQRDRDCLSAPPFPKRALPPFHPARELQGGLGDVLFYRADAQLVALDDLLVGLAVDAVSQEDLACLLAQPSLAHAQTGDALTDQQRRWH